MLEDLALVRLTFPSSNNKSFAQVVASGNKSNARGIVNGGAEKGVRVESWLVREGNKALYFSIVGRLKSKNGGVQQANVWLDRWWGKTPIRIQMLYQSLVWMHFSSDKEVDEVLKCFQTEGPSTPFSSMER